MLSNAKLLNLQFSFSNPDAIPGGIKRVEGETPEERFTRKARYNGGTCLVEPVENVSLLQVLTDLDQAGFILVDAFYKQRLDGNGRPYHMVRFTFCRHGHAKPSQEFLEQREVARAGLKKICAQSAWRVRAYSNPFFENEVEVPGERAVSINLEARNRLKVWQRDGSGEKIGAAPLAVQPAHQLRIIYRDLAVEEFKV